MVNNLAQELIPGGNLLHPLENFVGHVEQLPCIVEYKEDRDRWLEHRKTMLSKLHEAAPYTLKLANSPRIEVAAHSPVELRVYDTQGRVTGVVNGEEKDEIPYSAYYEDTVTIFSPAEFHTYAYEIAGTSEGSYDLAVTTIAERTNTFTLSDVPTSASVMHQYTIDWGALSEGKKGVTLKIDSDGDGTFEDTKYLGQEGMGFPWVWIVVAGVSGLLGILTGALIVRRRMNRKQVLKGRHR